MRLPDPDASRVPHPRDRPARRVKGYETAKDEYVRFEPEELKALEQESSSALVINSFVPETAVDPVYFEDTYYLGAGKNRERGYRVLVRTSNRRTGIAVGTFTWRGKRYRLASGCTRRGYSCLIRLSPPALQQGMRQTFQGEGRCLTRSITGRESRAGGRPGHRTSAERGGGEVARQEGDRGRRR